MKIDDMESIKEWLELADYIDDQGRDPIQQLDGWGVPVNAYARGYAGCHVHIRVDFPWWEWGPHDFCVEFRPRRAEGAGLKNFIGYTHNVDCRHSGGVNRVSETISGDHKSDCVTVPVYSGKVVEYGEQRGHFRPDQVCVESVVRLHALNDCEMIRSKVLQLPFTFLKPVGVVTDNELRAPGVGQIAANIQQSQLINKPVKGLKVTIADLAEDDGAAIQEIDQFRHLADVKDGAAGVGIELYADGWTIVFDRQRLGDCLLKGVSMLFSPLYLEIDGLKRRRI